jgi:hypothetical protein
MVTLASALALPRRTSQPGEGCVICFVLVQFIRAVAGGAGDLIVTKARHAAGGAVAEAVKGERELLPWLWDASRSLVWRRW